MVRFAGALFIALSLVLAGCGSSEERKLAYVEDGRALVAKGDLDNAVIAYLNAIKIDENYAPAHLGLGEALRQKGDMGRAATHLRLAVEFEPDALAARLDLAEVLVGVGEIEEAAVHADAALALSADAPRALAVKSATLMANGSLEESTAMARRALDGDASLTIARLTLIAGRIRAEDMAGALVEIDAAEAAKAAPETLLSVLRLSVLERSGDRQGVGAVLRRLAELAPDDPNIRLALVRWHLQGDPPELDAAEALLRADADAQDAPVEASLRLVEFLRVARSPEAARAELVSRASAQGPAGSLDLLLATQDARSGDLEAARARVEAAIVAAPDPERADAARMLLVRMLDPSADADRRTALITEVLERDPNNVDALTLRGELRIRQDRYGEAISDLRAALAGAPQSATILELMAIAHERDGAPELARERRALAAHVSDYAPGPTLRYTNRLMREGDPQTAATMISDALVRAPDNRSLLAALAEARLAQNDVAGAREVAARLGTIKDDSVLAGRIETAALMQAGQTEAAAALLTEIWGDTGGEVELEMLVRLHMRLEEPAKAVALIDKALADNPGDARAWLLLANVRLATDGPASAATVLRDAIQAIPDNAGLHAALATALAAAGDDAGAAATAEAGLALDPENTALRFDQARRFEVAGDFDGALSVYESLYADNPENMIVANNLASLLADHRDDSASLERAAAVARRLRGSDVPAFLDTYGWTLHRIGRSGEAAGILRQSIVALDGDPVAHLHLAKALQAEGLGDEAQVHFERVVALLKDDATSAPWALRAAEDAMKTLKEPRP